MAMTARASTLRSRLLFPAAGLSGLLMVLAFPRYGYDALIWVVLVPLFWAAAGAGPWRGLLAGWLAGLTLVGGGFSWVFYAMCAFTGLGRFAGALFWPWVVFESLPWAALGLLLGCMRRDGRPAPGLVLWAVPLWSGLEHYTPRLFPWHVGGALYARTHLVQAADLLGTSGLTALVLLANAALYLIIVFISREARFPWKTCALTAALLVSANIYGVKRLETVEQAIAAAPELRVGLVQPVASPEEKAVQRFPLFIKLEEITRSLTEKERLDLVVWPEGADRMGYLIDGRGDRQRAAAARAQPTRFEGLKVPLVAGTFSLNRATERFRNSAEYVYPGRWPPIGFYDKNVPLLFGEYVPFIDSLPAWLRKRLDFVGNIELGQDSPPFELRAGGRAFVFRILICYEAVLPGLVREVARGADFLVNTTEDIWYGDTSHVGQHVSVLALRAVEHRIPIVRCANAGPSGVFDQAGRLRDATEPFQPSTRVALLRPVQLPTVYARVGYWFPAAALGVGAAGFLLASRKRRVSDPLTLSDRKSSANGHVKG